MGSSLTMVDPRTTNRSPQHLPDSGKQSHKMLRTSNSQVLIHKVLLQSTVYKKQVLGDNELNANTAAVEITAWYQSHLTHPGLPGCHHPPFPRPHGPSLATISTHGALPVNHPKDPLVLPFQLLQEAIKGKHEVWKRNMEREMVLQYKDLCM